MVPFTMLWLPIVVSAVFVFIASSIIHSVLAFWHRNDYKKVPNESDFLAAIGSLPSAQYVIPLHDWKSLTTEERQEAIKGPNAVMALRNPHAVSFGKTLGQWFLYCLIVSALVGYLASFTLARGADYLAVHRVAGTAAIMAWALGGNGGDSVWFNRPWPVTLRHMIDGVIYGLITGGTFGWLWP